jgi:hypothetical protein
MADDEKAVAVQVDLMQKLDKLLKGKSNDFAASLALTVFVNVLLNAAGDDAEGADRIADDFCRSAKESYRSLRSEMNLHNAPTQGRPN